MEVIIASGVASIASALVVGTLKEHQLQEERHKRRVAELEKENMEQRADYFERKRDERNHEYYDRGVTIERQHKEIELLEERLEAQAERNNELEMRLHYLQDILATAAAKSAINIVHGHSPEPDRTREEQDLPNCSNCRYRKKDACQAPCCNCVAGDNWEPAEEATE